MRCTGSGEPSTMWIPDEDGVLVTHCPSCGHQFDVADTVPDGRFPEHECEEEEDL